MKNIINKIKELPLKRRLQFGAAILLTIAVIVAIPVYAWFSKQKKAAEMYKIEYPNSLYINAAHREDRINFGLDGIDVNAYETDTDGNLLKDADGNPIKITKKYYVFSVSGSNANKFTLQMAHTNNNLFTYTIYNATQYAEMPKDVSSDKIVTYTHSADSHTENTIQFSDDIDEATHDLYYVLGEKVTGEYKNNSDTSLAIQDTDDSYYQKTYGDNSNVEAHSVPSYWQAEISLGTSDIAANKEFCKYYILEVSWGDEQKTQVEKETDMIYFSVER